MNLVADESVEGPTILALRNAGHQVYSIAESAPGIDDTAVLEISRKEVAILLTADKDFGELVFREREEHCGVLLIRLPDGSLNANASIVVAAIEQHGTEMQNCFSVLTGQAIRIRQLN